MDLENVGQAKMVWEEIQEPIRLTGEIIDKNEAQSSSRAWGKAWIGKKIDDALDKVKCEVSKELQRKGQHYQIHYIHAWHISVNARILNPTNAVILFPRGHSKIIPEPQICDPYDVREGQYTFLKTPIVKVQNVNPIKLPEGTRKGLEMIIVYLVQAG